MTEGLAVGMRGPGVLPPPARLRRGVTPFLVGSVLLHGVLIGRFWGGSESRPGETAAPLVVTFQTGTAALVAGAEVASPPRRSPSSLSRIAPVSPGPRADQPSPPTQADSPAPGGAGESRLAAAPEQPGPALPAGSPEGEEPVLPSGAAGPALFSGAGGRTGGKAYPPGEGAPIEAHFGTSEGPQVVRLIAPAYPLQARRQGREGTVLLQLSIDPAGQVRRAEVVEGVGFGFDEAAVAAVLQSRFRPATRDGRPVACRALLPIRFRLREGF